MVSQEEFRAKYCKETGISIEEYDKYFVTLPCKCDYDQCEGWATIARDEQMIEYHNILYGKV